MTRKIPELRFAGFSGEWEEKKLGEIGDNIGGGTPSTKVEKYWSGDIPWYQSSDFIEGNLFNNTANKFINEESITNSAAKKVENIPAIAIVTRVGVGKVGLMNEVYSTSQDFLNFHNLKWDPKFSAMCIYKLMQKQKHMLQGTSIKGITKSELLNIKTIIPTSLEQEKIGGLFETLDACLEDQAAYVETLKKSKKAFLQKLFPQKGRKAPDLRFPGFEEDWEEYKISDLFTLTRGNVLSKEKIKEISNYEYKYPVYSSQTLNNGLLGYYNEYLYEDSITWTTDGANAGTVTYREGKFYSTNVNGVLLSDEGYSNKAVAEMLNRQAYKHVSRVGNPKLMNNVMADIKILLPTLAEQEKIGAFFKTLDEKIEKEEDKLSGLERLKSALLQKVFV